MAWLFGNCDEEAVTTLYLLWIHRSAADLGTRRGRWVAYRCALLCDDCAAAENDPDYHRNPDEEFLPVHLSAATKAALVNQVLAQVIGKARGYVPKADVRKAVARLKAERQRP